MKDEENKLAEEVARSRPTAPHPLAFCVRLTYLREDLHDLCGLVIAHGWDDGLTHLPGAFSEPVGH